MKLFSVTLLILLTTVSTKSFAANNSRSDTIDILHQTINLNITDFAGQTISGYCITQFKSKMNGIAILNLDLQQLTVDSVKQASGLLSYTHNGTLLSIQLSNTLNINDTSSITVYYHGQPATDVQWGGFYWSGTNYAYNLGVAFQYQPHNFGRAWFPCFDNFVERSTYTLMITTPDNKMAVTNGLLSFSIPNGNGTTLWRWEMEQEIPSYLVGVGVANYTPVWQTYNSIYGPVIPVMLAALPADTTDMKNSFTNLDTTLKIFEQRFGPYVWQKVGYVAVPFNSGAMEHATCISYPLATINGNTAYETLMAHEISHHWFGNLVTCETAEDMWLNEGWAVYCENLFTQARYGNDNYFSAVRANHETVVHYAHIDDSTYHPLSGMPQNVTYGTTTYKKGADVAHTLRSYMGDSLFFHCLKNYFTDNAFTNANSSQFRDYLSQCSGIDLTDFFHDWVFNAGFADFNIDSFVVTTAGSTYDVEVFIRQKLNHASQLYSNVPFEITFMDAAFDTVIKHVSMNGACGSFVFNVPFNPAYVGLDLREKISDSNIGESRLITQTGINNFIYGKMNLTVNTLPDTTFLRIEHHYAPPDQINPAIANLHISDYRYWKVDGVIPNGFAATATLQYNGSNSTAGGYLDNNLITNTEDSLVLLYRRGVHYPWTIESDVIKLLGITTDKKGSFKINNLRLGEYAWAIYDYDHPSVPVYQSPDSCSVFNGLVKPKTINDFVVFPSPSDDVINFSGHTVSSLNIRVFNLMGCEVWNKQNVNGKFSVAVDTNDWIKGLYFVSVYGNNTSIITKKFAVIH